MTLLGGLIFVLGLISSGFTLGLLPGKDGPRQAVSWAGTLICWGIALIGFILMWVGAGSP